ncbi:DUF1440 domain-containing protein [Psittacicella gerlachiana]|uniref:DUF1440 domain-containing protein n=1 Tax=Psittacicella gerlachiana TaxID=2028574 RepID=A0A3A1YL00_9GAMM|nr:DUF1440 domain-containing protein [Psittacicella gerlachiana]RIY37889.1 hypothetical protein CKF59_01270 [Psittacicella gerlachiana]
MNLLQTTHPQQRRFILGIFIALVTGFISAFVKGGWMGLVPTQYAHETSPIVLFLNLFHVDFANKTYTLLGSTVNWAIYGTHILFSIFLALIYVLLAEIFPKIRLFKGVAYGWISGIAAHYIVFPLLGMASVFTWTGLVSELLGAALWIWTIEALRAYMRRGATGYANAEDMPL